LNSFLARYFWFEAVLRIHDILGWIRIRILNRGSMPLTNGSIFVIDLPKMSKNKIKNKKFSAYYFLNVQYMYIIIKDKKSKRSHKAFEIKVFSYFFYLVIEGSGSIPLTDGSGSGSRRPKNMWIRWIRIWIRNTGLKDGLASLLQHARVRWAWPRPPLSWWGREWGPPTGSSSRGQNLWRTPIRLLQVGQQWFRNTTATCYFIHCFCVSRIRILSSSSKKIKTLFSTVVF
jgi:hypothetical protein